MGILSQTFGDKLNNFQTAPSSSSPIQVTTTSGKQYSLDGNQVNWIKSRYKQDGADTYGWDDADQYARQTGQLSAKMRSTYKNSNVDRQLAEMGLPSEKNLEKYIGQYQNWHTGTVDKVYKDVPKEQWSKISEFYKQDWVYESTAEDQARKKKGLMPTSLLSKYGDNELDESLMMRNLPSVSEMQKYAERYQNFTGIDTFYSNVAAKWTNMRLFSTDDEGNHIKNDDTVYTVDGEKVVGSDLYAAAFYDELLKKNENGERVYASITDLFQNNHVYEKGSSSNENYNIMRGKEVVSIGKAEALADDFLRYEAFSYDDFESKYGDYFSKLFADKQLMDGDGNPATYKDGRPVTAASQLAQIDEWEKLKEEADFYNIDHDASESFSDNTSVESFLDRWNLNNPTSSALDMFTSMREHGVDDKYIKQAYVQLRDSTKFGSEERKAVKQAWNDYKATIPQEERGGLLGKIAQANRDAIADALASPDTLLPNMQEYISGMDGGLTAANIKRAVDYYAEVGVEPGIVNETTKMMRDAYIANTDEVDPEVLKGFDYALSEDVKMTQRQLDESFDAFMKDSIVASSDASVVNNSWSQIEDAVGKIIGDSADASIDPDTLFAIIKATADLPWSNEIAVREALADHGFTAEGDFNDPLFANEWTKNWDGLDRSRFRSMMSDAGFRLVGDIDRTVPESFKKDPSERLTELISSVASKDEWNSFLFGGWNWDSEKTFSENIKNNLAPSRETESLMIYGGKDISAKEYELALDWMDEMVSDGRLTKFEAYNYLCSRGLQDAIEKYDKADWYESIFKEKIVPEMWENSAKTDQLFWDSCTDDDRKSIADSMWADIPDEEKAKAIEDYDWRFDSNIHRTAAQTWTEQLAATIPSAVLTVAGGAVAAADWAATLVSGKDELWETTKELNSAAGYVSSYGNVEDNVNGALASRITTDAVSEMLKMYSLGAVGGKVAGALGSSTSKMSGFILDFVKASPFSTIAIGNSFAEAKSEGASNAEALPYAFVLGTLEGVIESLNVDKIWGKVLGQGRFGKMLVEGGQAFTKQSVLTKAWLASLPVAALGEATEEGLGYCAEALWKTVASWGGSEWASNFEWSTSDMVEQALMAGLTGMLGAGLAKGSITTDSIMVDYYKNNGQLSADIVDVELASKYWDSFTDAQRSLYRNGGANVKSIDDFSNLMVQLDNCFRGLTSAQDTYSKLVANEDAKYEAVQRDVKKAEAKLASFNPLDPEQAKDFAKAYSELVKLKGDPNDANSTSALRDAKAKHDAALEAGAYNRDTTLANINAQIAMIQGQFAEHYAGLYLKNEGAIKAKDYNAIEKNMANAKKNGDRVTSETIEQPKNSAVDNTANPWWSKQKAAETMPARQFTTDDENQVLDAAKNMKYKGNISFVDMPNENWEGRINGNGDIEINRSKLTSREAQRISENPAMWVMEHELYHFIQSNGGDLASELRTTVRKMYEQDPRLARGNVSANWTKLLDSIIAQRNAQGLEISTRAQAEEEVLADFFRNYAFRSEDAIKSLCQTNGNLGERILSWLRYKINDLKLRRSKDSWAREILNVERQYALALREAGHKLNKAKAGDINTKYSSEKNSSAGNMTDDILNGYVGKANPNTGVTAEEDEAYMRAALAGDTETAGRMVRNMYERNGLLHVYRGEPMATGSWTQVDMNKFKANGMFATPDLATAQANEYTGSYAKEDLKTKPLSYGDEMPVLQQFADGIAQRIGRGLNLQAESYYMDDEGNTYTEDGNGREHHWALRDVNTGDIFADSTELTTLADAAKRKAARLVGGNPQNVYNSISDPFAGRILDLFVKFDNANEHDAHGDEWDNIQINAPKGVTLYRIEVTDDTDSPGRSYIHAYPIIEGVDADSSSEGERQTKSVEFTYEDEDMDYTYKMEQAFKKLFGPKSDVAEFFFDYADWTDGGATLDKVGVRDKNGRYVSPELFPDAETVSTDELAARDKAAGYDGSIIRNVRDGGPGKATDTVSFNPNYIKSADAITYDDNNNIIPLSQRGDFTRNELRYSGGLDIDQLLNDMANQGEQNSAYDNLVNQQGAKPQGKEPRARDIKVPERVSEQRRESDFVRSLLESDKVTDAQVEDIKRKIVEEDWGSYIPTTDQERMDEARDYISRRQPLQAQQEFHDMVMQGKLGVKTNALGIQLMADASARGDIASVLDIASDLQVAATEAGQSAQIFSVLKELKGVGSAWYMQKVVDRLNSKYADEISKGKMQSITVSPVLMEQLAQATTVDQIANAEEAVAKEIARQVPLTWTDRLSNWRYFSMLANPTTHVRNVTGNVLMAGLNQAKDAVATGIESAFVKDEGQRAHAILTAADKNAWGDFAQKSYEENARNLSGGGKLGFETFVKQNMRSFDTKWLNALAQFNFNALEGEDVLFIRPAYKNALMQYMKAQGFTMNENGDVGKVDAKGNFVEMTNAQRTAAEDWASQQAWKATFRDASSLATMLNKISKEGKLAQLIVEGVMPFKKTPINIARRGLEYSPAGIVMGTTQLLTKVKQGKMTAAQAIDNLASGITGSALMALGVFLAKAGLIRAGGEDEKKYETYLEDTGDQTYSMKFGDASINMSAIAPATIPLFMGVALNEMIENNGETIDLSTITDTIAGTLNPFMEMSFMSSLNSALKNYNSNGIGGALGSTIMTAGQNYFSQYLPTLGGKVAQFVDPTVRTTKSDATSPVGGNMDYYVRSLMKKVPGVEATLQPDVNVWGQTTTKDSFGEYLLDFANKFVLPTNVKITNRDAVDNELIRVVESTGVTDFLPSDGNKYFTVKGQKYTMNARQYTQYSRERGQAAYAAIKEVMASPAYITASDETKADMLNKAKEAAYKTVNNIWKDKLGAFNN